MTYCTGPTWAHASHCLALLRSSVPSNTTWGSVTASCVWLGNKVWESAVFSVTNVVCFCRRATLSMCYVSLFQLSEDPFNQAHAHPLRLVRGSSSMTREGGGGSQNYSTVDAGRELWSLPGSAPLLKQSHLGKAAQFCVRCYLIQYGLSFSSCFNREGLYLLRKC